jgi:hypothetical protein
MGYESLLMDIGMYGNVLALKYNNLLVLATNHTWFKNLWELLQTFEIDATFGEGVQLLPVRTGDKSLMSEFFKYYSGRDLRDPNIYRQFKKVIHLSCIVLSDGRTTDKECMNSLEGRSKLHTFPLQHPSRAVKNLWTTAIKRISSDYLVIPEALGQYIRPPHKNPK